jgi:hypothetical protein
MVHSKGPYERLPLLRNPVQVALYSKNEEKE